MKLRLRLAWHCSGAHYWCFSDFSWFVRLYTLGKTVRQFLYCTIGNFLDPYESHLPFTPVLTTRIITALPLLDVIVAFLSRRRRPVLQALSLLSSYNIIHTTQCSECTHFQWLRKILRKSERGRRSNISFITKSLQKFCRKNGIVVFSFIRTYFSEKKQKITKRPNVFFKANQPERKPKKTKRATKYF